MSSKKQTIILAVVIGMLILLLAGGFVLSRFYNRTKPIPEGTVGNTAGNSYNDGLFCEYNGVVYFSNPYDGGALYSMNPDESNIRKLSSAGVSHLNAGGNYLFYFQSRASGNSGLGYVRSRHGVFRASLNGKNPICLYEDLIFNLQLVGNNLYFLSSAEDGAHFYRMSPQDGEPDEISRTVLDFSCALSDGTVYYNGTESNHYLYRYNTTSGTSSVAWEGNIWYPIYDNGYIYYLDVSSDYRLCRYSLSGGVVEVLTHDRVDCYNLAGGYLYYQKNSATSPALMRMSLDGQNVETLMEGNFTHINATSRYVYFTAFDTDMPVYRVAVGGSGVTTFDAAMEAAARNLK